MHFFALPAVLLLSSHVAFAQTVDYSGLPSCAQTCVPIQQANQACIGSPAYQSCFCQSAYLESFYTTPDVVCAAYCTSSSDNVAIQKWYLNQCKNGGAGPAVTAAPTSSTIVGVTPAATPAGSTPVATPTPSGSVPTPIGSTTPSGSWWSQHYPWIIMVIVLILAFGAIIFVGVWLKRRHNRKRNLAASVAPPVVWGPHQNQEATRGFNYPSRTGSKGKGKSRAAARYAPDVAENPTSSSGSGGGKLKSLLRR